MLIRSIVLSLSLLVGIGMIVPFMTETTEAGPRKKKVTKQKVKKYSKAWWSRYRKEQRRKRAIAARKRALRAKQIQLARQRAQRNNHLAKAKPTEALTPAGKQAPSSFKKGAVSNTELQFRVNDNNGGQLGTASLTVLGPSKGQDSGSGRSKTVGGVPTSSLRLNVVDKMIKEDGWVVSDSHKEINGKTVYLVVGQSVVQGIVQSRFFYFTEIDGKIYRLATNSPRDAQERVAAESEKMLQSLQRAPRLAQSKLQ